MQHVPWADVGLVRDLLGDLHQEAGVDMQHAFRPAGRPARVADEQRMLAVERLGVESGRLRGDQVLPPDVALVVPGRVGCRVGSRRGYGDPACLVRGSSAIAFIGTGWPRRSEPSAVINIVTFASARRAATASGPNPLKIGTAYRPNLGACEERRHGLDGHRHEDADGVALPHARASGARAPAGRSAPGAAR